MPSLRQLAGRLARRARFEWRFARLDHPKVRSPVRYTPEAVEAVATQLRAARFELRDYTIDVAAYRRYVEAARYAAREYYDHGRHPNFAEKSLEHFIAAQLLALRPDDVYIDVGSDISPTPEIYRELFGCKTYRQDLALPAGVHGDAIGGDAGAMPLPDASVSAMALHCTFEHFEGDADTRFIRESARLLRPGGRVCILPLYLFTEYAIQTDLAVTPLADLPFEPDARLYCAHGYRNRHGRFYDVPHLLRRIRDQIGPLRLTLYRVTNAGEVSPRCYVTFMGMIERPGGSNPQ